MTFDEQHLPAQDAKSSSLLFLRAAQFTQSILGQKLSNLSVYLLLHKQGRTC